MSKLLLKVKAINTSRGCRCFLNKFFSTLSKPQLRRVFSIDENPCLTRMRHVTLVLQEFRETYSLLFLRTWFANEVCVVWVVLSVTAELVLFSSHSFKLLHTSQPSGPSHPGPGPRSPGPSLHQIHQQRLQSSNQASTTAALPRFVHRGTTEAFEFVLHGSGLFASPWSMVCHGMPWYAMVCMFLTRFQYVSIVRPPMLSHIFSSQCFNVCYPDLFGHCKISFYNHHDTTFNNLYAMDLYYLYYLYYLLLSGWNDHRPPPSKSSGPPLAMSPCCLQECQGAAETHDLAPILWLSDITNSHNRWITVHTDLIWFNYTGLYRLIAFNKNRFGRQRSACCEVEALEPNAIGRVHWHPLALANGIGKRHCQTAWAKQMQKGVLRSPRARSRSRKAAVHRPMEMAQPLERHPGRPRHPFHHPTPDTERLKRPRDGNTVQKWSKMWTFH